MDKFIAAVNAAIVNVLAQGGRSFEGGQCLYRGEGGRACVVGQLIKDEHYSPDLEGEPAAYSVVGTAVSKSLGLGCLNTLQKDHLLDLQTWHDECVPLRFDDAIDRRCAIDDLPRFIDKEEIRRLCAERGLDVGD